MSDNEKQAERFRHMTAAVDAIGRLMGTYEKDAPAQVELEKYRRAIMGVVFGEKAGVNLTDDTNLAYGEALNAMTESRLIRALHRMNQDNSAAELLSDRAMLRELLGK